MAINTITYGNKSYINQNSSVADTNKVNAADMNEIKSVVNANANAMGDLNNLNSTDKSSLVGAINEALQKVTITTLFSGVGAKATDTTNFVSTNISDNPRNYDVIIINITNAGNNSENINVVMTPKTNTAGVVVYFGATTSYYAYIQLRLGTGSIDHRIVTIYGWDVSNPYIKQVIGIKWS